MRRSLDAGGPILGALRLLRRSAARIRPGLWPGRRRQARRAGRGSARKGGCRRYFLRSGFSKRLVRIFRVSLRVEGPTRTMPGVPAAELPSLPAIGAPSAMPDGRDQLAPPGPGAMRSGMRTA